MRRPVPREIPSYGPGSIRRRCGAAAESIEETVRVGYSDNPDDLIEQARNACRSHIKQYGEAEPA